MVRDTNTAVNTLASRPIVSVVAKPRIGPVPNWKRNAAAMSDATWVSRMVSSTRSKPAATACFTPLAVVELFLDALEDQHVRVDAHADRQDEAGDAGQRHRRARVGHQAEQDDQVDRDRDERVEAGQLVVDEHEQHDQQQAARRRQHAGADRVGAERRADRALFEVGRGSPAARPSAASATGPALPAG